MTDESRVSPAVAHAKMKDEGFRYLDVRTVEEFEAGHPEGAFNIPISVQGSAGMEPNPEFLEVVVKTFPKETALVIGCKAGGRSARAARELGIAGFRNVLDQRAGWDGTRGTFGEIVEPGWSRCDGLPKASGTPDGRSYAALRK